jgi:V/A-type H+-transporting ATPase subunit E
VYLLANIKILKERLVAEAETGALEICKDAESKSEEIISAAEDEAEEIKKRIIAQAKSEAADIKDRKKTLASLENRKSILTAKQKEVNEVFDTALSEVRELEDLDYDSLIEEMVLAEVKTGEEELIFNPEDKKKFGKKFVATINEKLKAEDKNANLSLSDETRDISGGVILKEEGVENNNSFEALLAMRRDDLEAQVAGILFD